MFCEERDLSMWMHNKKKHVYLSDKKTVTLSDNKNGTNDLSMWMHNKKKHVYLSNNKNVPIVPLFPFVHVYKMYNIYCGA